MASFGVKASGPPAAEMSKADMVKRGDYLVNTMGCGDCHTPFKMGPNGPEPDMDLFLSGHPAGMKLPPPPGPSGPWNVNVAESGTAWAGPWGISYTQNLTPDPETGIAGTYTEEQFIMTIREGKKQGRGRAILPPMPWPVIRNLTDDDLKAIFAYLGTVKPIRNKVPEPVIAEMR
ncbi:MAG: c-type cytochrome [Acidobacteriota bacterium]|nr:c-type cytochrome [Acidobacteriota bacterium]